MQALSSSTFEHEIDGGSRLWGALVHARESDVSGIADRFSRFKQPETHSSETLDRALADFAMRCCEGNNICAVGLSLCVPNFLERAGGLIGPPDRPAHSAGGLAEPIGNGLAVAAMPGGPGFLIEGKPSLLEAILAKLDYQRRDAACAQQFLEKARERGVDLAMAVLDGCGGEGGVFVLG
ncbi:MAG: hypothetical protein ACOC29_00275 [Candidatus Sumerlaeota bacterium]